MTNIRTGRGWLSSYKMLPNLLGRINQELIIYKNPFGRSMMGVHVYTFEDMQTCIAAWAHTIATFISMLVRHYSFSPTTRATRVARAPHILYSVDYNMIIASLVVFTYHQSTCCQLAGASFLSTLYARQAKRHGASLLQLLSQAIGFHRGYLEAGT